MIWIPKGKTLLINDQREDLGDQREDLGLVTEGKTLTSKGKTLVTEGNSSHASDEKKQTVWAKPNQLPAGSREKRPIGRLFSSII